MILGDIVQLKGSKIPMTVIRMEDGEAVCAYDIICNTGKQLEYRSFPIQALKPYPMETKFEKQMEGK